MLNLKTVQPEAKQRLDGSVMVKFKAGSGMVQRNAKKKPKKEKIRVTVFNMKQRLGFILMSVSSQTAVTPFSSIINTDPTYLTYILNIQGGGSCGKKRLDYCKTQLSHQNITFLLTTKTLAFFWAHIWQRDENEDFIKRCLIKLVCNHLFLVSSWIR